MAEQKFGTQADLKDFLSKKFKDMEAVVTGSSKKMSSELKKSEEKSKTSFQKMGAAATKFRGGMNKVASGALSLKSALVGFVGFKVFQSLIAETAKLGDDFDKMSFRLGVSTEFLQELDFAAGLAGTSVQTMQTGIRRLSKSAVDSERGMITAKEGFEKLNINVRNTSGEMKTVEQLFGEVVPALGRMESSVEKVAIAQDLLGRSGTELLPLVAAGADAFEDAKEQARDLGIVMDKHALKATVDYTDAMHRFNAAVKGVKIKFLIPILRDIADNVEDFIAKGGFDQYGTELEILGNIARISGSALKDAGGSLHLVITLLKGDLEKAREIADDMKASGTALGNTFQGIADRAHEATPEIQAMNKELEENRKKLRELQRAQKEAGGAGGGAGLSDEQIKAREKQAEDTQAFELQQIQGAQKMKDEANQRELDRLKELSKGRKKIFEVELKEAKKRDKDSAKALKEKEKNEKAFAESVQQAQFDTADALISAGGQMAAFSVKSAKSRKVVAFSMSVIEGILATQRALAFPPGPPATIPTATATGVKAAANSAIIAAQPLAAGGVVNQPTLALMGEAGPEGVLNAGATARFGIGNINALNTGQTVNNNVTHSITFSPSVRVVGSGDRGSIIDALDEEKPRFAEWFKKEVVEKNYF